MDFIQNRLITHLPPSLLAHITTHSTTYWSIYQDFLALSRTVHTHVISPLTSLLSKAAVAIISTPGDLASFVILLIVLIVSLKIMDMMRRAVMFWVRLALRIVFWSAIFVGLALWIGSVWDQDGSRRSRGQEFARNAGYQVPTGPGGGARSGFDGFWQDLQKWVGVWKREYEFWRRREREAQGGYAGWDEARRRFATGGAGWR